MVNAKQLATALPDWMVEHPLSGSEDELRLIIASNILDNLGPQTCVPDAEELARAISKIHDTYDYEDFDEPEADPELDARDEWWMSPRQMARVIVKVMRDNNSDTQE
jgi:hypothetical protein